MSRDEKNLDVEHIYRRVNHEITKALQDGDVERAHSMASRAADGHPKVMPKLDPDKKKEIA